MSSYRFRKTATIALVVLITTTTIQAEEVAPAIAAMRQFPPYRHAVETVFQQYESSLRTHCATIKTDWGKSTVYVATQPALDAQKHIVSGIWVDTVPGEACGQHRRYNAVIIFHDGQPAVLPLFPGESESNPLLQKDTLLYVGTALAAAAGVKSSCHIDILETQLPDGHPAPHTPWMERWRADACGKQYWLKVNYIPDATGTTIDVKPSDVAAVK